MTPASSGLQLDPADPGDAKIIARQAKAARQAGRDGLDRAKSTRGRTDLEAAYDEGANEGQGGDEPAPEAAPHPRGVRGRTRGFRRMGPGWSSVKPSSPARPPRRLADTGSFLAGLALYTVAVTYVRYGPEGWKGWLRAKFLNQPMTGATGAIGDKPKHANGGSRAV